MKRISQSRNIIRESARTPYVGMNRTPPLHNTLHSQPYLALAPEQTFSPQIRHRLHCSNGGVNIHQNGDDMTPPLLNQWGVRKSLGRCKIARYGV